VEWTGVQLFIDKMKLAAGQSSATVALGPGAESAALDQWPVSGGATVQFR